MVKSSYIVSGVAALALLVAGCGSSSSSDTTAISGYDVTVERGPILHSVVIDANGQKSFELGNGKYRFAQPPVYPVTAMGGFIDIDRDGIVSVNDVNNTIILRGHNGSATTLVNTIAADEEIKTWLTEQFGLTEDEIYNATPNTNATIAAISDVVFAYCVENNLTSPESITLDQLKSLENDINDRISLYINSEVTTADLEEQLVDELNISRLTSDDILNMQNMYNGTFGGGGWNSMHNGTAIISTLPTSELTNEQKYLLAYMWNEEKLAKDIYFALNEITPHQALYNIAANSETTHEAMVEALIEKYDLNITNLTDYSGGYSADELSAFAPGQYELPEIENLYNVLYEKGSQSLIDALQVGCMVEVTDINDLDKDIATASGADDLVMVFSNLRSGSYNHYWAFDSALKALGVSDGCCSAGEEYCKTADEYPLPHNGHYNF
ncbi:ferritin-like domain-containing protein [Hydrogenimonas thermophila]|uniref:DUF2202 domain-containing protein n=1 Tax=Hydrogenimonas thermophila TaxID=223786 RepID=A0A1I5NU24_9BACT|nr:DUF2202 domain-containing protein [Hydrogenimonas thermophila]WOE68776.1 DUF2202 domain-containing protein [Hydrogenimonas thermophila]WOE71286.1 DUF2202 domain-containing protein [Hydrogenimonas thermophila]SFP24761.1 hypothetical protein SAMN05216234_1121 [Hydrogenimonas thermophila]